MLTYIFIGLALGAVYAMAAASIVVTYESAGILNFAFGSMAFFVAKFYYWMNTTHGWGLLPSGVVTLLVVSPLLGIVLYLGLFKYLRERPASIKIVVSIGVSVALPALAFIAFGNDTIDQATGLASQPVASWRVLGATIDADQLYIYGFLVVVLVVGLGVLRFTEIGLKVRAMVNSEALTSLSGANPNRIALGVWAVSGLLAGAVGVLVGPTIGVTVASMTSLMASAFAAVVAARLRRIGVAVAIALLMGVVTDLAQYWLPNNSTTTSNVVSAVPFIFTVLALVYHLVRNAGIGQEGVSGGALDAAVRVANNVRASSGAQAGAAGRGRWFAPASLVALVPIVVVALLPALMSGYWLGLVVRGIALALVLLSFSLVVGDGGMLWLCQITFAGGGALIAAELSSQHGFDPILAAFIGAALMVPVGILIGALTIRLGDLYVALVTLSFGLLVDNVVFSNIRFHPGVGGVAMPRPALAPNDRAFGYFALVLFLVIGLIITNLRRSTTGLALTAMRSSGPATRTLGVNILRMKLMLAGVAAFVAGLGGALLSMYDLSTDPLTFGTFGGLVWLAVLVTIGVRSLTAALLAGIAYMVIPALFATYLSASWLQVPSLLFGLGAIGLAIHPEGVVAQYARNLQSMLFRGRSSRPGGHQGGAGPTVPVRRIERDESLEIRSPKPTATASGSATGVLS